MPQSFTKEEAILLLANSTPYVNPENELKQEVGTRNLQIMKDSGEFSGEVIGMLENTAKAHALKISPPEPDSGLIAILIPKFQELFPGAEERSYEGWKAYSAGLTVGAGILGGMGFIEDESKRQILFDRQTLEAIAGMNTETARKRYTKEDITLQ